MLWQQGIIYLFLALVLGVLGGFVHSLLGSIFRHLPGTVYLKWLRDFCFCLISALLLLLIMGEYDNGRFRLVPCMMYVLGWWQYAKHIAPSVDDAINRFFTVLSKFVIIDKSRWHRRRPREDEHRN